MQHAGTPPASGPVFHDEKPSVAIFVWATIALLLAAGLGYALYERLDDGGSVEAFHDAPEFVLSSAHNVVSQVIDNEALRGFHYQVAYMDTGTPLDGVRVNVPPDILPDGATMEVGYTQDDAVPEGMRVVSPQIHIGVDDVTEFEGHIQVTIPVADDADADRVVPVAFDPDTGTWDTAGAVYYDVDFLGGLMVEIIEPSIIGLVEIPADPGPFDTGFVVDRNGWGIDNDGIYLDPGGDGIGMASWAKWLFQRSTVPLANGYSAETEDLLASRVHLAQSETWADWTDDRGLQDEASMGLRIAGLLQTTQFPQIMLYGTDHVEGVVLATAYDGTRFTVYDPDEPGTPQYVPFDPSSGFGSYRGHDSFGYTGLSALSGRATLAAFQEGALDSRLASDALTLTEPLPGQAVDDGLITVAGTVSGDLAALADEAVIYAGSTRFTTPINGGSFSTSISVDQVGRVPLMVLAGPSPADQSPDSAAAKLSVERQAGVVLLVTLTWDQPGTDVDLYVTEPDGETKYYANKIGADGGIIDQDITSGYGPEHYTLDPSQGHSVDAGTYTFRVHYYAAHGGPSYASGTLTWVDYTDPLRPEQHQRSFYIGEASAAHASPGDWDHPSWTTVGTVTL